MCGPLQYIIMKAINGFLMTQSDLERRIMWVCNVRELHRPHMSDAVLAASVDMTLVSSCTTSAVSSELRDQLAIKTCLADAAWRAVSLR